MPVNYFQLHQNLEAYSQKTSMKAAELNTLEEALKKAFEEAALDTGATRARVERAERELPTLYCAKPTAEPMLTIRDAPPKPERYTLAAADGSQIAPNRHRPVQFCVINVGLIKAHHGSGLEPTTDIQSELMDQERLFTVEGGLIGEDTVGLQRDLAERRALLKFVENETGPVVTLTDGPLDVYQGTLDAAERQAPQAEVYEVYQKMAEMGVINAGYIDKPGSEMLTRMLALTQLPEGDLAGYDQLKRSMAGISDARLLKHLFTRTGQRSAIFEAITKTEANRGPSVQAHFFYLNVEQGEPYLARVEFPGWVSERPELVDLLHAVVYAESQVLETHPYPYLLHRAHELAVITFEERVYVEDMLLRQLDQDGLGLGRISNKEVTKEIAGGRL